MLISSRQTCRTMSNIGSAAAPAPAVGAVAGAPASGGIIARAPATPAGAPATIMGGGGGGGVAAAGGIAGGAAAPAVAIGGTTRCSGMVGAMLEPGALRDLPGERFGVPTNDVLGSFSAL